MPVPLERCTGRASERATIIPKGLVALVALLQFCGCPNHFHGFGTFGRITDPQVILDALKARREATKSAQGEAKAYLSSPRGGGKLSQFLVAEVPDRIRIESLSFFGDPIAVLTSDGQHFALHAIKDNRFYEGTPTPGNVSRLLPLELRAGELVSLVLGLPPLLPGVKPTQFTLDEREGIYRLALTDGDTSEVIDVETSQLQPVRVVVAARPGLSAYTAELGDYDATAKLPKDIQLITPDGKTTLELKWRSREVNGEIDEQVFIQPPPEGVPRTQLSE